MAYWRGKTLGQSALKALLRLVPYIARYRWQVVVGFVGFFLARFFEVSTYYGVALGIDAIGALVQEESLPFGLEIWEIVVGIVSAVVLRFIFVSRARRAFRLVGQKVSFDLREQLFASVLVQGPAFFGRIGVGDLMTRAIQDISLVQRLIAFGLIQVVIMVYAPLFGMTAMLFKSVSLTVLILPLLPILYFYAQYVATQMAESSQQVQESLSMLAAHTQENLSGIRTVQAQAQEENEIKRFFKTNNQYASAFYEQARINSLMTAWTPWLTALAQLAIIVYGGNLVLTGALSVGDLIFFLACLNMLLQPIRMAGFFITMVARAKVGVERLCEVFDAPPEIIDRPTGEAPALIGGAFVFKQASFTYPGAVVPALTDLNFSIERGESIGIVGRVGSGKSTLLKLCTRLLELSEGSVELDGVPIDRYALAQLRSQIAQVLQDPFLFGEPLSANISYDDPERALDLIWDAADAAALRETVLTFPEQMSTLVGERGVTLSGGQKQRTTLARGLIRNAPVLILDDCFSAVDTETEEHILSRLKRLRAGKTTILVSHRVSTLRHTDRILVLDGGRLMESGSHDALLAKGGLYAELERLQTQGQRSDFEPELV